MNAHAVNLAAPTNEKLAGIKVVDADTHLTERYDLWTSRAPAKFRDRVPQVREVNGRMTWYIDGDKEMGVDHAVSAIRTDGTKADGVEFFGWQHSDVHPGSYDLKARLGAMDETGIFAQIVYPNVLGFGGQKAMMVDEDLRRVSIEIFNDAMGELQADSGGRLFPMALLPWWDMKLAKAEAERCAGMGLRGVNTNPDPQNHGLPDLGEEYWYPLWETCSDLNLPVNFHIGASDESVSWFGAGVWPSLDERGQLAFGSTMLFVGNQRVMANIILSRFLEKFPKLKMVSVESGAGWVPFLLEALEYQMRECGLEFQVPPSEIFRRQMYACTWFERKHFVSDVRKIGVDNIMFETDFPHPTCLYPGPLQYMEQALEELTLEEVGKVFSGNAAGVYNIPIPR